jgi:hypothetical protein
METIRSQYNKYIGSETLHGSSIFIWMKIKSDLYGNIKSICCFLKQQMNNTHERNSLSGKFRRARMA